MDDLVCESCRGVLFRVQRGFGVIQVSCVECGRRYVLSLAPDCYPFQWVNPAAHSDQPPGMMREED